MDWEKPGGYVTITYCLSIPSFHLLVVLRYQGDLLYYHCCFVTA